MADKDFREINGFGQTFTAKELPKEGWKLFRKKTKTSAVRIDGPFRVDTREGPMTCEDGWLAVDADGNPYPIAADVFVQTYEPW